MKLRQVLAAALAALVVLACDACANEISDPSPTPSGIEGTWTGEASDSSGPGRMTWQVQQDVSPFSGVLLVTDTYAGYMGKGSVSGTVIGTALHFTLKIPVSGFDPPFESCTAEMVGDGLLESSNITGTYAGTSSCGGAISGGQFTLVRE